MHGLIQSGLEEWLHRSLELSNEKKGIVDASSALGPSSSARAGSDKSLLHGSQQSNRFGNWFVSKGKALARQPWWLVLAVVIMSAMIGFGIWGVVAAANSEEATRITMATTAANEKALNVKTVIDGAFNPCVTMAMLVRQQPLNMTLLNKTFYEVADDVLKASQSASIYNLQLAPSSIVTGIVPDAGFTSAVGLDLLTAVDRRPDSLKAIAADAITVAGPNMLVVGISGMVGRYPIFVPDVDPDETFGFGPSGDYPKTPPACCNTSCVGLPPDAASKGQCCSAPGCQSCTRPYAPACARWDVCSPNNPAPGMGLYHPQFGNCTSDICYINATRSKFWGFTQVVVTWEKAKQAAQLYELCAQFDFIMTYTDVYGNPNTPIAMCSDSTMLPTMYPGLYNGTLGTLQLSDYLPRGPVSVTVQAMNNQWTLWVVDKRGWTPDWRGPLVAAVVVIALLVTALVVLLIASHLQQQMLLEEQKASNKKLAQTKAVLEAEKATTDALIVRQLNLISCFATADEEAATRDGGRAIRTSMEHQTLRRIEAVRRQVNSGQRETEEVQVLDMLGEGSFGKVYHGLWRGSDVAVKTIVLPANMSGAAKREKMAIMEAAISSSLAHPNVVQTYTYSIRPLRDAVPCREAENPNDAVIIQMDMRNASWQHLQSMQDGGGQGADAQGLGQIISYEVRLVLEYCDRGCLRDALDAGVFFGSSGLNYKAILDTASDVAKAMVHLHLANVLHSDLKARNIMLKSSGQEGRGACAKVADFGLSISLDSTQTHMSSMYQGTITHMAPEVLMKGHVSKAADVYAFGIVLWEIVTGQVPFREVPGPHLGHAITVLKKRPNFSLAVPRPYKELAEDCWADDPEKRPSFQEVLDRLQALRAELPGPTEPMPIVTPPKDWESRERPAAGAGQIPASRSSHLVGNVVVTLGLPDGVSQNYSSGSSMGSGTGIVLGGPGGMILGVGPNASLHACLPRSRLAGVPEGHESSEETTAESRPSRSSKDC